MDPARHPQLNETGIAVSDLADHEDAAAPRKAKREEPAAPQYELYRTCVNLFGIGAGEWIEIDPTDPRWAGAIEAKFIVANADWEGERPPEYQ
jgi:hypothetical protein